MNIFNKQYRARSQGTESKDWHASCIRGTKLWGSERRCWLGLGRIAHNPKKDSFRSEGAPWTCNDPEVRRMAEAWSKVDKRKGNTEIRTRKKMLKETESSCPAYFLSVSLWENSWVFTLVRVPRSRTRDFEVGQGITDSASPSPTHPSIKVLVLSVGSCTYRSAPPHLGTGYICKYSSLPPRPPKSETLGRPRQGWQKNLGPGDKALTGNKNISNGFLDDPRSRIVSRSQGCTEKSLVMARSRAGIKVSVFTME